jgi:hypothetical protein
MGNIWSELGLVKAVFLHTPGSSVRPWHGFCVKLIRYGAGHGTWRDETREHVHVHVRGAFARWRSHCCDTSKNGMPGCNWEFDRPDDASCRPTSFHKTHLFTFSDYMVVTGLSQLDFWSDSINSHVGN